MSIDLISGESSPNTEYAERMAEPLAAYVVDQLEKRGFARERLKSAEVNLEFRVDPTPAQMRAKYTWGEPFMCQVVLTDDLGAQWTHTKRGWCGKHNPKTERKSARAK